MVEQSTNNFLSWSKNNQLLRFKQKKLFGRVHESNDY